MGAANLVAGFGLGGFVYTIAAGRLVVSDLEHLLSWMSMDLFSSGQRIFAFEAFSTWSFGPVAGASVAWRTQRIE